MHGASREANCAITNTSHVQSPPVGAGAEPTTQPSTSLASNADMKAAHAAALGDAVKGESDYSDSGEEEVDEGSKGVARRETELLGGSKAVPVSELC